MPTTIYLVRHATPDWTRTELSYHLPPGPPLTEEGLDEAKAVGGFLHKNKVTLIYTSPLARCLQTAQAAGKAAGVRVEVDHSLTEWQPGETYTSVARRSLAGWVWTRMSWLHIAYMITRTLCRQPECGELCMLRGLIPGNWIWSVCPIKSD
jgi:broad specificity phosphatase PhoE